MTIETDMDRAIFIADWGVEATLKRANRSRKVVKGIFDNAYTEVDVGGTVGFATVAPRFLCRTADLNGAADADSLDICGDKYLIRIMQPDGTGMTEIFLEKQ